MYANEVEESHIERDRGLEMIQRFAESQTRVRKASQVCSHAQIGAFNVGRANTSLVRVSADDDWDSRSNF
jgi:hypothetical protein